MNDNQVHNGVRTPSKREKPDIKLNRAITNGYNGGKIVNPNIKRNSMQNRSMINAESSTNGESNNETSTNSNNDASTIDNNISNQETNDNNSNSSNETKGKGVLSGLKPKNPVMKLLLIGGGSSFLSLVMFIVILIAPLMVLGIIDIEDLSSSGLGYSTNTYLKNINNECNSIIVDGTAVNLEDYVAGVVSAEAYTSEGMEALKAQAIAARTYAIVRTNHCKNPIKNSSYDQNYTSNIDQRARQATTDTKGMVLTYNSQLFSSEYDSFYKGGDYSCDDNGCSVTYTKLPNNEKHTVNINPSRVNYAAGGHGRGMSQVASYDLAAEGYKFDYILSYFYSPGVQINSLYGYEGYTNGNSASSSNFISRTTMPNANNENDKRFYYSNENLSYAGGWTGQCTWYAYGRANEILAHANSDLKWSYAPHAKDWFEDNLSSGSKAFSYSTNVTEPKAGAIIVWSSNSFGHVAVVEKVNSNGTIDYSEANINSVKNEANPYGFRYQSNISYTETGVGSISSIWSGYKFVGYIYMVE